MTDHKRLKHIKDFIPGGFILIANAKAKTRSNLANVIMPVLLNDCRDILFNAEAMRQHEKDIAPAASWINPELIISASEEVLQLKREVAK